MSVTVANIQPIYQSLSLPALKQTLAELVQTVDRTMLSLATKAIDNSQQNRHFEAVQQLRIIHREVVENFIDYWLAPLNGNRLGKPANTEHVDNLGKLLSPLAEQAQASFLSNDIPDVLSAKHISESFLYSVAQADLATHSKMLLLRGFNAFFQENLAKIQQQADLALSELGIQKNAPIAAKTASTKRNRTNNAPLFSALQDIQANDYENLDANLQAAYLGALKAVKPARNLLQEVTQQGLEAIAEQDQLIIQDIQQLFDIVLKDERISPIARALLAHLQLPYTRVALQDAGFFDDQQNLAKSLLNELVRLAAQWPAESEHLATDPFYLKLTQIIHSFAEAERIERIDYQELLFDLLLHGENERHQQQVLAQRIEDTQQNVLQANLVRKQIDQYIQDKISDTPLPAAVQQLLDEGWRHVMYLVASRYGYDDEEWYKVTTVLDQLLATLEPAENFSTRSEYLRGLPLVLKSLREGLSFIELPASVINLLFSDLETEHKKRVLAISDSDIDDATMQQVRDQARDFSLELGRREQEQPELVDDIIIDTVVEDPIIDAPPKPAELSEEEQQAQKMLASIGPGVTILWNREEQQLRCRIAAFIKHTHTYILTDPRGSKTAELSEEAMLEKLLSGEIQSLESGKIFSHALESVIGSMREPR